MYAIAILRYRVPLDVVESATEEHRAYLRDLKAAALDAVRDGDPFWKRGIVNYELLPWNPVLGREGLDAI